MKRDRFSLTRLQWRVERRADTQRCPIICVFRLRFIHGPGLGDTPGGGCGGSSGDESSSVRSPGSAAGVRRGGGGGAAGDAGPAGAGLPGGVGGEKKLYRCQHCKYVTDRKNNLKRHVVTMHEQCQKTLECCDCIFKNKVRKHSFPRTDSR